MEQDLVEDLAVEAIRIHGVDFYNLPRSLNNLDTMLLDDSTSSYDSAYLVDMYVKDVGGFHGLDQLMKGVSGVPNVTDEFTLVVARKTFQEEVGDSDGQVRPNEGDLVYFPMNKKVYRVNFVEHESVFYQMGALQVWELRCAIFQYSGETFNTGIPEVDKLDDGYNINLNGQGLLLDPNGSSVLDEDGLPILFEPWPGTDAALMAENDYFQLEGEDLIDWSELDAFSKIPDGHY
jgi:hypothetical protein